MKPIDYLKALGVGLAVLALNLLATTAAIFAYSMLIYPGQSQAYYSAKAPEIGAWTGPIGGVLLLGGACWLLARRRPERPAVVFAAVCWVAYASIDTLSGLPMAPLSAIISPRFAVGMALALAAAIAGGVFASRQVEAA